MAKKKKDSVSHTSYPVFRVCVIFLHLLSLLYPFCHSRRIIKESRDSFYVLQLEIFPTTLLRKKKMFYTGYERERASSEISLKSSFAPLGESSNPGLVRESLNIEN